MNCITKNCLRKPRGNRKYCQPCFRKYIFIPTHPYYDIWYNMKRRCYDKKMPRYEDWGGRGIKVCDAWLNDYYQFESDMGMRPPNHQLDRIDNDGDYTPENCRWVLAEQNSAYGRRRKKSNNTSGVTGVYWNKATQRWQAYITIHKRQIHLGGFVSKTTAIHARKSAEQKFAGMTT